MDRVNQMIADLIEREGAFVDHADDRGGATMYGITEQVARLNDFDGPMHHMPRSLAIAIYKDQYWSVPNFDRVAMIDQAIAEELMDTGVNMGIARASIFLQRSLNALNNQGTHYSDIVVDGLIGNATLAAMKNFLDKRQSSGQLVLLKSLNCLQGTRYIELSESRERNESFLFGWLAHRVSL